MQTTRTITIKRTTTNEQRIQLEVPIDADMEGIERIADETPESEWDNGEDLGGDTHYEVEHDPLDDEEY